MEFKFGDQEKAKNMFESVLTNFPSRVEVWILYLSMLIKYNLEKDVRERGKKPTQDSDAIELIRSVFERSISCITSDKKRVSLLKKYLDFETKYGNEGTLARINQKLNMSELTAHT
jgi:rRNA biogenesis protein RRP5